MTHDTPASGDGPRVSEPAAGSLTFEQALSQLDETVRALETGDLPLSEATTLYEKGMRLARICSEKLEAAQLKISQIQTAYGEQMRLPGGPDGPPC